jgi:transposase-like protein
MGRRLFTAEFKRECAELVLKQHYKVKDAAEASIVSIKAIYYLLCQLCFGLGWFV